MREEEETTMIDLVSDDEVRNFDAFLDVGLQFVEIARFIFVLFNLFQVVEFFDFHEYPEVSDEEIQSDLHELIQIDVAALDFLLELSNHLLLDHTCHFLTVFLGHNRDSFICDAFALDQVPSLLV